MSDNVLAIVYDVWISGTKLSMSKKACITSVEVKETTGGSDTATLQIVDPEFIYIEDNIFIEDNAIKISLGWSNTTHRETFEGFISAIDINFDSDGTPKITLTCMDKTHTMNRKKKNNTFKNCTSAEVVKKIVKGYGYTCVVDSSYKFNTQETITQSDQTDIEFIQKLAGDEVYPFTARLVGNTFYYVKMGKLETPKLTLTYRKYPHEIISFSPKINKETKKEEVSSSSMDTSSKDVSSSTATKDNTTSGGSASSDGKANTEYTYDPKTKKWTKS